ncbi:cobalamin B12-binding domain-containing protein [Actinocorallia longicatena]|uniref:Cobalamin B12-binding domain-containing protein n=1 Tax=Actinocorallia longicatena TaxID=111803 RepID=A0ABP6QNB6_9ACTN
MTPRERHVQALWNAVADGDHHAAAGTALEALEEGKGVESVLLGLIAPVQMKVGAEWAAGRMTVAQEHIATSVCGHATEMLVARRPAPATGRSLGRIVVTCSDREWHAFPARLLAVVLQLRGWHVDYLGAQMPTPHLIAHLRSGRPDAVALSSTTTARLPAAHAAVAACHALGVPVLVGGAGHGPGGRYAARLAADGWAPDAGAAADLLDKGVPGEPRPGHRTLEDLPHLADQEYTLVSLAASDIVKQVLFERGALDDGTAQERRETTERVTETVEALAASLYLDDSRVFLDALSWTVEVLARRAPSGSSAVPRLLDALTGRFADFDRTRAFLAEARSATA